MCIPVSRQSRIIKKYMDGMEHLYYNIISNSLCLGGHDVIVECDSTLLLTMCVG